jgi:cell division protein FtsI/penicillin-binding protein 2
MKNLRRNLVFILISLFSAAVVSRLIYLQIINHQYWAAFAQGQQNIYEDSLGERGKIFLEGNSLAVASNRDSYFVYLSSQEIEDTEKAADFLSGALGLEKDYVSEKMADKENLFSVLKKELSDSEVEAIEKEDIKGVYVGQDRQRYYSQGSLASDILGFVDTDENGRYGVEGYYDEALKGEQEVLQGEKGPSGFLFFSNSGSGDDIYLTIDYNIQFTAEKLLKSAVEDLKAKSGQIIVANPYSGAIIAMADYPSFDPNDYADYAKDGGMEIFQNAATQELFEPGSVMKPITMAIGIEKGAITPQTSYVDEGYVKFGSNVIYNYGNRTYGKVTMTNVLEKSINTGVVFVEKLLSHETFLEYLNKFGFFKETGIDYPEVYSENKELKKGYEINYATASFGQGIDITPLQLIRAFCAIANGGKIVTPYIVEEKTENGQTTQMKAGDSEQIISAKTALQVTSMMVSVVENGYGKAAKVPGYYIAGKTGTAQVSYSALGIDKSGYSDETIQSFIGFAPAFDPQFLILIKLDNPAAKTAEYSAVPVFHDLAKYIIDYWKIAPDYEE